MMIILAQCFVALLLHCGCTPYLDVIDMIWMSKNQENPECEGKLILAPNDFVLLILNLFPCIYDGCILVDVWSSCYLWDQTVSELSALFCWLFIALMGCTMTVIMWCITQICRQCSTWLQLVSHFNYIGITSFTLMCCLIYNKCKYPANENFAVLGKCFVDLRHPYIIAVCLIEMILT